MFVFGDDAEPRRFGLPAALTLVTVACATTFAVLSSPDSRSAISMGPPESWSCTPGTLRAYSVEGDPVEPREMFDSILASDAKACEYLTGHDPQRSRLSPTEAARNEADTINNAVEAAICPDPALCLQPRHNPYADVAVVRSALLGLGYPEPEVRPAEHVGESPQNDVVYGVHLRAAEGCLVSFARGGVGVAPMGPVGVLSDGRCLHAGR